MTTSKKLEFCLDSNIIGMLYEYIQEGRACFQKYPTLDTMTITTLEYFFKHYKRYDLYITPQVLREAEYGMSLLDDSHKEFKKDYLDFIKKTFIPIIPFGYANINELSHAVNAIKEKYLEENIPLSDKTSKMQSAITYEDKDYSLYEEMKRLKKKTYNPKVFEDAYTKKSGVIKFKNYGDAIIVTENNMFKAIPLLTLNERHLVKVFDCAPNLTQKDLRSAFILEKNKEIVDSKMVKHKKIIANFRKKTATTMSIKRFLEYIKQ